VTATPPPTAVTVLTRQDCASCVQAKQVLNRVATEYPLSVQEISLDTPPGRELALAHGVTFAPGVLLDGALFSYGRLSERKLRRTLARRVGG
jgi:glutaredoxin